MSSPDSKNDGRPGAEASQNHRESESESESGDVYRLFID